MTAKYVLNQPGSMFVLRAGDVVEVEAERCSMDSVVLTKGFVAILGVYGHGKDRSMLLSEMAPSIKEIKAAFPKMKDSFFVKCLERELPIASVASAAAEELMAENQELMAKVAAMEEEMTALKARGRVPGHGT